MDDQTMYARVALDALNAGFALGLCVGIASTVIALFVIGRLRS